MKSQVISIVGLAGLVCAAAMSLPGDARAAAVRTWSAGFDGDRLWSTAANWNGGTPIANGDFLVFGEGSTNGVAMNDLNNGNYQRITLEYVPGGHVLAGNGITLGELVAAKDSGLNEISLNIAGEARTLVADGALLTLSGANTFTGDIDVAGRLTVLNDKALGAASGSTNILPGGNLEVPGRDLGNELLRISPHDPGDCAITIPVGDTVLRNIQVGKGNCITNNGGTLNFPNGIQPFAGEFDLLLFGGTILVGGTSAASGPLRATGDTHLAWNSNAPVDIDFEPFEQFVSGGTLTGAGGARSLDFRKGLFEPGNGGATGRFSLSGDLSLEDVTLTMRLNGATTGTGYSQVQAGGVVTLGPNTNLDIALGFQPDAGQSFRIINNTGSGAVIGTFAGLPEGAVFSRAGRAFRISYKAGTGNDVEITATNDVPVDTRPFKLRLPMVAKG